MQNNSILVVKHKRDTDCGHVGRLLAGLGYRLDIRCPREGDPLPGALAAHAGAVIFGGPMSANDPDEYIKREIDWISVALEEKKPFLGICLGGQMLAKCLGSAVKRHASGAAEIGYHRLVDARPGWPRHVYHWHVEGFDLPSGACPLAQGELFPNQAFQFGPSAFGLQFHPEITLAMINRWTVRSLHKFTGGGVQTRHAQMDHHARFAPKLQTWLGGFLRDWLASGDEGRAAASLRAAA